MNSVDVSFIVPVRNEQKWIEDCLNSIIANIDNSHLKGEIIIIDDHSTDNTPNIINTIKNRNTDKDIKVLASPYPKNTIRIGGLRSEGVNNSSGKVLVFIDGDVILSDNWHIEFTKVFNNIVNSKIITGSQYDVDHEKNNWILNSWFAPMFTGASTMTFINAGHLIISRELYDRLGGFDSHLETGEDFEFCQRAVREGVEIFNNTSLRTIHQGYPITLQDFFNRERWHGKGNWKMKKMNKMLAFTILFWLGFIGIGGTIEPVLLSFFLLNIMTVSLMALKRCGVSLNLIPCSVLSFTIFTARGVSLVDVLRQRTSRVKS